MKLNKLIEYSLKEDIGKHYLSKALTFALNNEFGKAYEFFKEGLNILTCDCKMGWLNPNAETNKKIFDDINVNHTPHFEYYFVKAYILSYEDDKKSQYLALEAIEKYLEVQNDEYGNYVKGKILLALDENQAAFEFFEKASKYATNSRLNYRLGRTKEQFLEQRGLNELYFSFVQNPSSPCCARVLKKHMKERGKLLRIDEGETNPLLIAFNSDEESMFFLFLYQKLFKSQHDIGVMDNDEAITEILNSFIKGIENNRELFVLRDYEDAYDEPDYDDYKHQTDWTHYNDNLDMDQQSIEFWNQF